MIYEIYVIHSDLYTMTLLTRCSYLVPGTRGAVVRGSHPRFRPWIVAHSTSFLPGRRHIHPVVIISASRKPIISHTLIVSTCPLRALDMLKCRFRPTAWSRLRCLESCRYTTFSGSKNGPKLLRTRPLKYRQYGLGEHTWLIRNVCVNTA